MSTQSQPLVFEGPDPKRLLLEVWSAHGRNAKISEPVAIREGGVMGFFAKMRYRVEVIPAEEPEAAPRVPQRSAAPRPAPAPVRAAEMPTSAAAALEALIEGTEDSVELDTSAEVSFDEILDKVASSLGEEPEADLAVLGAAATQAIGTLAPTARPGRVLRPGADGESARITDLVLPKLKATMPAEPSVASPPRPLPSMQAAIAPRAYKTMEEELAELTHPTAPAPAGVVMPSRLSTDLALVGFPIRLLSGTNGELSSLEQAFALAPVARALPKSNGSLIAVVGAGGRALSAAKAIAAEIGMEAAAIPRALARRARSGTEDHLVVHDATEAADLSPGWRRGRAVVVTVSIPSTAGAGEWTRSVLEAMGPSMTLCVASAAAKTEDVQSMVEAIGGADGLVLEDCDQTLTPASILSSGLPIFRIDGAPAGAGSWAAAAEAALARRASGW